MSALVPYVLEIAGSNVASALQRIRPSHLWPTITSLEAKITRTGSTINRKRQTCGRHVTPPEPTMGDAAIAGEALGDWVAARIVGRSLEVTLRNEDFELSTKDGTDRIRFASQLPDTVIIACPGFPLIDVVDHPLLRPHGYMVERATQLERASSLAFDIGRLPLQLPWRN